MAKLKIFGDSILKGVIYSSENNKYCLCEDNKYSSLGQLNYTVENKSRMGATIDRGLAALKRNADTLDSDSVVLLEFGGNDSDYNWQAISDNPDGEYQANTPEHEFIKKYEDTVNIARQSGARVIISTLIPIDAEKYMNWISRGRDYGNILRWLGDISMLYRWQEYYSNLAERVAARCGCLLIDLRRAFLLDHNYKNLLCADGIHPTQAGHDKINRELFDYLKNGAKAY